VQYSVWTFTPIEFYFAESFHSQCKTLASTCKWLDIHTKLQVEKEMQKTGLKREDAQDRTK